MENFEVLKPHIPLESDGEKKIQFAKYFSQYCIERIPLLSNMSVLSCMHFDHKGCHSHVFSQLYKCLLYETKHAQIFYAVLHFLALLCHVWESM